MLILSSLHDDADRCLSRLNTFIMPVQYVSVFHESWQLAVSVPVRL
jgi:hypothetical protein